MLNRLKLFLQESKKELQQVNWPGRGETIRLTSTVILVSLFIAVFLGFFDFIFRYVIDVLLI